MENFTWFGLSAIECVGYVALAIILFSLSLFSIVKLRVFNLLGSALFSYYGFYIGVLPIGILHLGISLFNIYFLWVMFRKEELDIVEAQEESEYLNKFLNHYRKEINHFFPNFVLKDGRKKHIILALRDLNVAGVFISSMPINGTSEVLLDFVTPQYRDYKTGKFLFKKFRNEYLDDKTKLLTCITSVPTHAKYLKKIGFQAMGEDNSYFLAL